MIKVGILGTARIARAFFGAPMQNATIIAIASREQSRADAFAADGENGLKNLRLVEEVVEKATGNVLPYQQR